MSTVRPEYYVNLKGKQYPTYNGVLIAATEAGLKSLTTELIQAPTPENEQTAIVRATAIFADDRVFSDYGDASPRNTSPQIATASIRMASTRAKGRVLRDGIGLGETMREEIPDDAPALPAAAPPPPVTCDEGDCGLILDKDEIKAAQKYAEAFHGARFCKAHGKVMLDIWKAKQAGAPSVAAIVAALPPDPFADEE